MNAIGKGMILAVVLTVSPAFADPNAVNLYGVLPSVTLKDGRSLTNVKIAAFGANTVMAKWDGGMGTIAYGLLPDAIRALAESHRPAPTSDTELAAIRARAASEALAADKRPKPTVRKVEQVSDEEQNEKRNKAIKEAAKHKADHYFRYEYIAFMTGVVIERLDLDLGSPREVSGWGGRFEVEGKCGMEYYDSVNVTLDKTVAGDFTVTVEWDGTEAKVVDFQNHVSP